MWRNVNAHGWWESEMVSEWPHHPAILLLGMCPKKLNTGVQAETFTVALFTEAKVRKQPRCPSVGAGETREAESSGGILFTYEQE